MYRCLVPACWQAGNWVIDQVKIIDVYPQRDQLANIRGQSQGTGGVAYNVCVNLARLQRPFPAQRRRFGRQ